MNDNDLRKVNTLDRYEADVKDWTDRMEAMRKTIDLAELTGADCYFTDARKTIADLLGEFEQARHFIAVKRAAVNAITPDVPELFEERETEIRVEE